MSTTTKPRFRIRRALRSDAVACQEIRYTAFRPGPITRCMFTGNMADETIDVLTDGFRKDIETDGKGPSRVHVVVAELFEDSRGLSDAPAPALDVTTDGLERLDTTAKDLGILGGPVEQGNNPRPRLARLRNPETGGTIVGFAKWHLYRQERSEDEWAKSRPFTREEWGENTNLDVAKAFFGGMRELRKQHIAGRPHFILSLIACSPVHPRLGVATALVRWGTELADREGFECWLESTPPAYPVYTRCGFKDAAVMDIDVTGRWGLPQAEGEDWGSRNGVAVAEPLAKQGWLRMVLMNRQPTVPVATST